MKPQYEGVYTLRASDFDCFGRILPSAVLDLFQDVAGRHAEELGIGFEAMLERKLLWVIARIKFQMEGTVRKYQTVRVRTWPLPPSRLGFQREYVMEDTEGNVLIRGTSEWLVIHSEERRVAVAQNVYPFTEGFVTERMQEEKLSRVPDFEAVGEPYCLCPGFSALDNNNHVNNTKYADFVWDAVSPTAAETLHTFQIDYRKEVVAGTELRIRFVRNGKELLAKGENDEGKTMFNCRVTCL